MPSNLNPGLPGFSYCEMVFVSMSVESIRNGAKGVAALNASGQCLRSKIRWAFSSSRHFKRVFSYGGRGIPSNNQAGDQEFAVWRGLYLNGLSLQLIGLAVEPRQNWVSAAHAPVPLAI